jgi:hypothetical protein
MSLVIMMLPAFLAGQPSQLLALWNPAATLSRSEPLKQTYHTSL